MHTKPQKCSSFSDPKPIAYRAYAKENLLAITLRIEGREVKEAVAYLRFSQGFRHDGNRGYDTKNSISVKFSLFELAALGKALAFAAKNNGDSTYIKYAGFETKKRVTIRKRYINASEGDRYIGVALTRYEMEAIADDIRDMVKLANSILWSGDA